MLDSRSMRRRSPTRPAAVLLCVLSAVAVLAACGEVGSEEEVDRQEIEDVLREYLPKLGQAYASRDTSVIEGFAVPKELAWIKLRTDELSAAGRV